MRETPVGIRQSPERVIECEVERPAAIHQLEQPPGRAARGQPLGQVSIPAIGVDGTATSRRGIRPALTLYPSINSTHLPLTRNISLSSNNHLPTTITIIFPYSLIFHPSSFFKYLLNH
jgi:hypothetical protein